MSPDVDPATWAEVLDGLDDEPPALKVADALASATAIAEADAYEKVTEAIDEEVLVERGEGFGYVALAEAYRDTPETPKPDESGAEDTGKPTTTPGLEAVDPAEEAAGEHVPDDLPAQGSGLEDGIAQQSGEWFHPPAIQARDWWVAWILDGVGRKRPVAPWQNGHAYPAEWSEGLDEDERPETGYPTARRWVEFPLTDLGLELPEDAQSDELGLGVILPAERPEALEDRIALIDWDDVRDPDTEEIHPAAAEYIDRVGGYVEISTSGEGLHQFVTGGLRHRGKFIAPIDDEPFIGDDLPQVEIYDGGRHVAMTGKHVAGTDLDVAEGQAGIDDLVTEYAEAETDAGHRRYDPETGEDAGDADEEAGASVPKPDTGEYGGPSLEALRETKPSDRSLDYHAAVETFYRGGATSSGYAYVQNWRLEGFVAALGERDDLDERTVKNDLSGGYLGDTDAERGCIHRTPERIDYGYERANTGRLNAPSYETLVDYGILPPTVLEDDGGDSEEPEEYRTDPREVEATVDPRRAWDAAGRVTPDEVDSDRLEATEDGEAFATPNGEGVDVVRAVAIAEGLVDTAAEALEDEYPEAYRLAREAYGAPLPKYYTEADALDESEALIDLIAEVTFWDLDGDALESEITEAGDEVGGDAVRALNPSWRESKSEASVLVFEDSGTIWDADTKRKLDALRFVALDRGLIDDPYDTPADDDFTEAYRLLREEYDAPLPLWYPADDGTRDRTPQLPPSDELLEGGELDGVDPDALEAAREDVEELIDEATADGGSPTVVNALPATGKTTGTVKTARERPLSYLAPRKELQQQALRKADRWGVAARICPVFSENRVRGDVLGAAVSHVREHGKNRLRDRWAILSAAFDDLEDEDSDDTPDLGEIFVEEDEEKADLERPTCETAEGKHGVAWALAVHTAREAFGLKPREIHTQAEGIFGASLPCTCGESDCEYTEGWDDVADADDPPDLVVGSYIHAHVESVRTKYDRAPDGTREKHTRGVVLDEFIGEAFTREFGEEALDHATWLASALREDVVDRRDMIDADLYGDEWVREWLDGNGADTEAASDVMDALTRIGDLYDAREAADRIRGEVEDGLLRELELAGPLDRLADGDEDPATVYRDLRAAIAAVDHAHPARGIVSWATDDVAEPLGKATVEGASAPTVDGIADDGLPFGGDLEAIVSRAAEAVREGSDAARTTIAAATTALSGGPDGCRRLAAWADDGYAHPDAHHLLRGVITPTDEDSDDPGARRIHTDTWAFDPSATDGTVLDVVETTDRGRTVVDRNDHGALLHTPPARTAGNGEEVALVGLDATGRAELWANALGEDVTLADIHDTPAERAEFLLEALDLRVIQAAERPRYYSGDPTTKDTDGDAALLEAIADEYSGIDAPRRRGEAAETVGKPAAITTKGVRNLLEDDPRLDDVADAWENYGNVTGANDLGDHRLAAVLGCQHYGDDAIERFCAIGGREVDTSRESGRGAALGYDDELADAYLKHMSEDQTMQAILRFARGDSGATVVARTSTLREDLPVLGDAQVVETWSDTATAIAREYRRLGGEFSAADVRDAVDVGPRQVRRVLAELVDAGYLRRVSSQEGVASTYERAGDPGAGEVDLPDRADAVDAGAEPGRCPTNQYYTWNVRVSGVNERLEEARGAPPTPEARAPPAPTAVDGVEPPT